MCKPWQTSKLVERITKLSIRKKIICVKQVIDIKLLKTVVIDKKPVLISIKLFFYIETFYIERARKKKSCLVNSSQTKKSSLPRVNGGRLSLH